MADKSEDRLRGYIVIAATGSTADNKHYDCKLVPYGDPYPATYTQVYGPASEHDCKKWMAANCGGGRVTA